MLFFRWGCIVLWPPGWFSSSSSSSATTFFFVCSFSFYHTELHDLPNLMRGLAGLRSVFHLQMQFLMPGVKMATLMEIHLKLATQSVIFEPKGTTGRSAFHCNKEGFVDKVWMQVHGYSPCVIKCLRCGSPMSLSVHFDVGSINIQNILFFGALALCEYLLFYLFFLAPLRTWASSQQETALSWTSGRKPASQNRPHFLLSPSGTDVFWALLSSPLS